MRTLAWCHNGYQNLPASDVIRRSLVAGIDALIVKYGNPAFEREISAARIQWGTERFAYAAQASREGAMLADVVDAGASFAVANCEPNDGGGWDGAGSERAIRMLIDAFRTRHPNVPLFICADLRRSRSHDAAFVREAAKGGINGWMPMVYPKAFDQRVQRAFDAAYPGPMYLGLPCAPVLQTYDAIGPALVRQQFEEAARRGASSASIYVIETASEAELVAVREASAGRPPDANALQATALAYQRGVVAILDHGTPSELRAWAELFGGR